MLADIQSQSQFGPNLFQLQIRSGKTCYTRFTEVLDKIFVMNNRLAIDTDGDQSKEIISNGTANKEEILISSIHPTLIRELETSHTGSFLFLQQSFCPCGPCRSSHMMSYPPITGCTCPPLCS